ncbi:hypothetical protein Tco_1205629 [Tanacetum coccineum]
MAMEAKIQDQELKDLLALPESWIEKMESVFHISKCTVENQVKFATCTLLGASLTCNLSKKIRSKSLENEILNRRKKGIDVVGNVISARPKTVQETIKLANDLMDQKVRAYAGRQAENKRKFDNNNQAQQQLPRRQNVVQAYTVGSGEKKDQPFDKGLLESYYSRHQRPSHARMRKIKRVQQWSDCPELRNRNHGNQAEDTKAHGVVYALGGEETDQDPNNIEDEIEAQEEDFLASTSEP